MYIPFTCPLAFLVFGSEWAASHKPLLLCVHARANQSQTDSFSQEKKKILNKDICSWKEAVDGCPVAMSIGDGPGFLVTEIPVLIFQFFL